MQLSTLGTKPERIASGAKELDGYWGRGGEGRVGKKLIRVGRRKGEEEGRRSTGSKGID